MPDENQIGSVRLTYPRTHKISDLKPLYEIYKRRFPEVIAAWVAIERKSPHIEADDLPPIAAHLYSFLQESVLYEGPLSLLMAFLDFRKMIVREYLGYSLVPEGH